MAAYQSTRSAPLGAITTYRVVTFFSNIANAFVQWNDTRVTRNALSKLSNRELDDIGLCRDDISRIGSLERL